MIFSNDLVSSMLALAAPESPAAAPAPVTTPVPAAAPAPVQPASGTIDPAGDPQTGTPAADPAAKESFPPQMWLVYGLMAVMLFFMFRGPQKKQKELKKMMDGLKRGDRIRTIGGILATVVEVGDDEVVIKIDETNNTKMKVIRNAIATVIKDDQDKKTDNNK